MAARATLASILSASGVAAAEIERARTSIAGVFDLRKVRASQPYRLDVGLDGAIRTFDYEIDGDRRLEIRREGDALNAAIEPIQKTHEVATVRGTIDRGAPSLFAAMNAAGGSVELSMALAEIFGGDVDFNLDVQPGDAFELLVDKQFRVDGADFAGFGPILAAQFTNAGRPLRAFRFVTASGESGYYDERGVSTRRFFLKSPLKFEPVVTSAFSTSRFHPILQEYRAHLGVDYGRPPARRSSPSPTASSSKRP